MFTGTIESRSHEGGLLVHFEGSSPALNAVMVRADDGTYIGKVDGVLGNTGHPLAHIAHIDRSLNQDELIGLAVTVRAKKPREPISGTPREDRRSRNDSNHDRRERSQGDRGDRRRSERRGEGRDTYNQRGDRFSGRQSFNEDWTCPSCNNSNFARRDACNRCQAPRPAGGQAQRGESRQRTNDRGSHRSNQSTYTNNDWTCPSCSNSNFSFRENCNRCDAPRPGGAGNGNGAGRPHGGDSGRRDGGQGGRQRSSQGRDNRSSFSDRRPSQRGARRDGPAQGRDNRSSFSDRRPSQRGDRREDPQQGRDNRSSFSDRRPPQRGDRREGPQQGRDNRSSSPARKPAGTTYRKARGKRAGHAHNQEPRDFRTPRSWNRKDDD